MTSIGLFYGSSAGNTAHAAQAIQHALHTLRPDSVTIVNVATASDLRTMQTFDKLLVGVSSWIDGDIQEDWQRMMPRFDEIDLNGKQAAIFGLGDQVNYPDAFQDALGIMGRKLRERGAALVGFWPTKGYRFTASQGVENGKFMGLALDYDNELHLNSERISQWSQQLAREFQLT